MFLAEIDLSTMQQNDKVRGLFQPILGTLFDACNIAAKVTSHFGRLEQV